MTGLIGVRFQEGLFLQKESDTHLMGTGFKERSNVGVNVGKRSDVGKRSNVGKRRKEWTSGTNIFCFLILVPKDSGERLGKMLGD